MSPRYAVIPTHDRPIAFATCLRAIYGQVDHVIVISHRADAYLRQNLAENVTIVDYDDDLPNISRMWNMGLLEAEMGAYAEPHHVAVLNDDAVVPPGWFDMVAAAMIDTDAPLGCSRPGSPIEQTWVKDQPDEDIYGRLAGYAFIIDGTAGLRADEQFQWWWGDTDLDWRARVNGGTVIVPGPPVAHPPGGSTPTVGPLATIAGEDRERFVAKWGTAPW